MAREPYVLTPEAKASIQQVASRKFTPQELYVRSNIKAAEKAAQQQVEIFSGGKFRDVIDVLSLPQYALTGLFSKDLTVGEAVKKRATPSSVTGTKGIGGFALDVLLDPLTYLGGFGLTKAGKEALKAGTLKTTLGASTKAGQRAGLRLEVPFTDLGINLTSGKRAGAAATKLGEAFKSTAVGGKTAKVFGALPATGGKTIDEIEGLAGINSQVRDFTKALAGGGKALEAEALDIFRPIYDEVAKLKKKGITDSAEFKIVEDGLRDIAEGAKKVKVPIPSHLVPLYEKMLPLAKAIKADAKKALGGKDLLKGKGFTNVALKEATKKPSTYRGGVKVVGQTEGIEKGAEYFKVGGQVAKAKGKNAAQLLASDQQLEKVGDLFYDLQVANQIKGKLKQVEETQSDIARLLRMREGTTNTKRSLDIGRQLSAARKEAKDLQLDVDMLSSTKGMERTAVRSRDVNELQESLGLEPIFKDDILEEMFATSTQAKKAMLRDAMLNELKKNTDILKKYDDIPPKGYEQVDIPQLKGYAATPEVKEALEAVHFSYSSLGVVEDFFKGYNKVQNTLKKILTFMNVAFHSRNVVSNSWNQFVGGVRNPKHIASGYYLMKKVNGLKKKGLTTDQIAKELSKGKYGEYGKYYKEFMDERLGGTGAFIGDFEQSLKKENLFFRAGSAAGSYLEDSAKLGMYIGKREQGFIPRTAGMEVKKYLFDYTDLTEAERVILKTAFPFYTWMRKNIPLQVATLIQKPRVFSVTDKAVKALEQSKEGQPIDERLMPEWMRESYNMFLGNNPEGASSFLRLEGYLPVVDIGKIFNPTDLLFDAVSPLIKTPAELLSNYDFFYENQIKQYEGQRKEIFGMDIPLLSDPRGRKVFDLIRPAKDLERLLGMDEYAEGGAMSSNNVVRYFFGANVKSLDPVKQQKTYDYLVDKEIQKIKPALKKAKEQGDEEKIAELQNLIDQLESGEREVKL